MPRMCGLPFCCVAGLEIRLVFLRPAALQDRKISASAARDFCFQCPLTAARRAIEYIPCVILRTAQQSGRGGSLS